MNSMDSKEELTEADEKGLCIFRRVFVFIEQPSVQMHILQRVLKLIVLDLHTSQRQKQLFDQVKLNLKLIHLL